MYGALSCGDQPAAATAEATAVASRRPRSLFPADLPTSRNAVIVDRDDDDKDLTGIAPQPQSGWQRRLGDATGRGGGLPVVTRRERETLGACLDQFQCPVTRVPTARAPAAVYSCGS